MDDMVVYPSCIGKRTVCISPSSIYYFLLLKPPRNYIAIINIFTFKNDGNNIYIYIYMYNNIMEMGVGVLIPLHEESNKRVDKVRVE